MTFKDLSKLSRVCKDTEFKGLYIKMFGRVDRGGNNQKWTSHNQDDWQGSSTRKFEGQKDD